MNKIKFTSGTIEKVTEDFYNLILKDENGKVIYKGTIDRLEAARLIDKYDNQKIRLVK